MACERPPRSCEKNAISSEEHHSILAAARMGGCVIKKNFAKPPQRTQPGWLSFCIHRKTTPASRSAEASRYLDRSATPPCLRLRAVALALHGGDARRHLRLCVNINFTIHSQVFHRLRQERGQGRPMFEQRFGVEFVLIRLPIFPAPEQDPDPLIGQGTNCSVVAFATPSEKFIMRFGPLAPSPRMIGEFLKRLSHEFRTCVSPMHET